MYSFQDFSPNKHSIILWEDFDPDDFSKNELYDVYVGNVLRRGTRFVFPLSSNTIKASIIFISNKDPRVVRLNQTQSTRTVPNESDLSWKQTDILNKMMIVKVQSFLGCNFYEDMHLNRIDSEILEFDFQTKKKFVNFWFLNMLDFHLEFFHF